MIPDDQEVHSRELGTELVNFILISNNYVQPYLNSIPIINYYI